MIKARKKSISIIMAVIFLLTVLMPVSAFAADSKVNVSADVEPVIAGAENDLGTITIKPGTKNLNATLTVKVTFPDEITVSSVVYDTDVEGVDGIATADDDGVVTFTVSKNVGKITIEPTGTVDADATGDILVDLYIERVKNGVLDWTFPADDIKVATVAEGDITITVDDPVSVVVSNEYQDIAEIKIKESQAGTFMVNQDIYFELVSDKFAWAEDDALPSVDGLTITRDTDDSQKLIVTSGDDTTVPTSFSLDGLSILVYPGAPEGDVEVNVTASEDLEDVVEEQTIVVATLGDTEVTASVDEDDIDTIYLATENNEVPDITLESTGTAMNGTLVLTLPEGFEWAAWETENLVGNGPFNDDRSLWYAIDSDNEITLDSFQVNVKPDAPVGDLEVEVSGTLAAGSLVIAEVAARVTATAEKPVILINAYDQAAGNITITETAEESLGAGTITFTAPRGVTFVDDDLKVEVNGEEDGTAKVNDDANVLTITLVASDLSKKVDTIVISGILYDADSRAKLGDIVLKVGGTALDNYDSEEDNTLFEIANATIDDGVTVTKTFKVGDEGVAVVNGRTLVQVNLLCDALGLQKSWDSATKTAYFVKDGKVVAFPMTENAIYINGVKLPVDQGGAIINDYTYATLRGIQMAFGGELSWDNATKTATFVFNK